ncbi:MAG: VOC family protein [Planctomycetes bacterium]|nr:VOC family protein [Planctomycetota bacterium]
MSQSKQPIPPGLDGLIPHLVCDPCAEAMEFYKKAFAAEELARMPAPDGRIMHAAIRIGNATVFLVDDFPEYCGGKSQSPRALGGTPVTLHRYVTDCDAAIQRAVDAGATILMPAQDMFWGDRYGVVTDPFGHSWYPGGNDGRNEGSVFPEFIVLWVHGVSAGRPRADENRRSSSSGIRCATRCFQPRFKRAQSSLSRTQTPSVNGGPEPLRGKLRISRSAPTTS